ncbi:hypothetical protein VTN00DRAFT_6896 [Thermoascus crustaceus]|uniref:uncharacterized protein n=1 Tax=Thermoascus crustaceus TaxID=5088 RepID=UPI003742844A
MPSLLDLPREDRPDLRNRDFITTGDWIELNDIRYRSWFKYARRSLCTNSSALLLVNRQLRAERATPDVLVLLQLAGTISGTWPRGPAKGGAVQTCCRWGR